MDKMMMAWMAFYFSILIVGLATEGSLLNQANMGDLNSIINPNVSTDVLSTSSFFPLSWFAATVAYLRAIIKVLFLDFKFWNDGSANLLRMGFLSIGAAPLAVSLLSKALGR